MKFRKYSLNLQMKIALLSAIAFILMFINTPLIVLPSFLRIDISDLPEVIALMEFGFPSAVIVSLIKNLLHLTFSQSAGIGEFINFIMAISYLLTINLFIKKVKNLKMSLIFSTILIAIISIPVNKYIMFPLYELILHINIESIVNLASKSNPLIDNLNLYLWLGIMPFNFLKFSFVSMIAYSIEVNLKGVLKSIYRI